MRNQGFYDDQMMNQEGSHHFLPETIKGVSP